MRIYLSTKTNVLQLMLRIRGKKERHLLLNEFQDPQLDSEISE